MERTKKQLNKLVEGGDFYEAQQLYKATHRRLMQRKKYAEAKFMLESGAEIMIKQKQYGQANELISLLLSLFAESPETASLETISNLFDLYPTDVNISGVLNEAIRWNQEFRTNKENIKKAHPSLLLMQATRSWVRGDYGASLKSFLEAEAPEEFIDMLSDWTSKAMPSECDLICTRAVLLLLTKGNLKEANEVFEGFTKRFYASKDSRTPLINFTQFLLLTLERDAYPFFQKLTEKYQPSIQRDQSFEANLERIAEVFFRVAKPQPNNFLGDMLKSFLGGGAGAQ